MKHFCLLSFQTKPFETFFVSNGFNIIDLIWFQISNLDGSTLVLSNFELQTKRLSTTGLNTLPATQMATKKIGNDRKDGGSRLFFKCRATNPNESVDQSSDRQANHRKALSSSSDRQAIQRERGGIVNKYPHQSCDSWMLANRTHQGGHKFAPLNAM